MDIIQQKLIWLMSSGIALLMLFRLKLARAGVDSSVLLRLKTGFILILSGSVLGLVTTIGLSIGLVPNLWQARFIETVMGYLLGWFLIISGFFAWGRRYFDRKGRPLLALNAGILSDKISKSLIMSHRPNQMIDTVGDDVLDILSCQAVSLHRISEDGDLRLTYALGLTPGSKSLVELPVDERHMFKRAMLTGQAVISDKDMVFGDGSRLESRSGPLISAISLPVRFEGVTIGIMTLYRTTGTRFSEDDANLMDIVCDGVGISLARDIDEKKRIMESRYREMVALAVKPFDNRESLASALIKSAKIIHGYIPFRKLTLYIHGNGVPRFSDYNLSTGGLVSIATGYFSRREYPDLGTEFGRNVTGHDGRPGTRTVRDRNDYVIEISGDEKPVAHMRIDLPISIRKFPYLPVLGEALVREIGERLKQEKFAVIEDRMSQWLGALSYYQEKSISAERLSEFLYEIASLAVNVVPTTFCQILISDPQRKYLKTAALAQARDLDWRINDRSKIEIPNNALHKTALQKEESIYYTVSGTGESVLRRDEIARFLPDGISHGLIVPVQMGDRTVALLTMGESRNPLRAPLEGATGLFLSSLAGLVSVVLTRHMDKRAAGFSREGKRSLTLKKREQKDAKPVRPFEPGIRSRINGPLAGIMASCEYIQSRGFEEPDVVRFIEIIQRNAAKIQDITTDLSDRRLIPTK